jgi:hypothetical protein
MLDSEVQLERAHRCSHEAMLLFEFGEFPLGGGEVAEKVN